MRLVSTILCGGAGSRLWPVSRELHPKPFIRMADGQSLLQKAFLRASGLPQVQEILTVTNRELFFKTQDEYREVNAASHATAYVLEPFGRNTAAAVAAAALQVQARHGDDAVLLVLPADHLIENQPAFDAAVMQAMTLAMQGEMVVFGIKASRAETGFGYIEADGSYVRRFVEKPSAQRAAEFLASGRYVWNAGIFCFTAQTILTQLHRHCPAILAQVQHSVAAARVTSGAKLRVCELPAEQFSTVPEQSLDYAVMEPASVSVAGADAGGLRLVPCEASWHDIGAWPALAELLPADAQNNRIEGQALLHDSRNCYVRSPHRLTGGLGLDDLVIVDTADALLVAHRTRAQDVRALYAQLKAEDHEVYRSHRTVHRPWGSYTVLEEGPGFKIKRIEVKPGASLSLQLHHHRSEHWVVVSGIAKVTNCEQETLIRSNESAYIAAGHKHRLENPGDASAVIIEVQSGSYLGEDDIVRFSDLYDRTQC